MLQAFLIPTMGNAASRDFEGQKQTVFKSTGVWVYRIPVLFYERESETLLAFAEQRANENDTSAKYLVMKRGKVKKEENSGVRTIEWSEQKIVERAQIEEYRPMNPCPVYEKNSKTLFLFFICVEGTVSEEWQKKHFINKTRLCYITSKNLGQSWSKVTDLTNKLPQIKDWATFAVGPGNGLQTDSGRLIVPTYAYAASRSFSPFSRSSKEAVPHALALCSEDSGKTWNFGKMLQAKSLECEMAEFFDNKHNSFIYCNARNQGGYRVEALDKGDGFTTLPCPGKLVETDTGCQGSVISFPAQSEGSQSTNKWLLYTHPTKSKRVQLGAYLNRSPQDPKAWNKPWIINSGPSGYSDLAYIGDGWFACLMECGDKKETEQIACVAFSYEEVKQGTGE